MNHLNSSRTLLFGYFCLVQDNGAERILINRSGGNDDWLFPVVGEFDLSQLTPDQAIDEAVISFIDRQKFASREEMQTSGLFPYQIHRVELSDRRQIAYFFKARVLKEIGNQVEGYLWVDKVRHFNDFRGNCLHPELLDAIEKNMIYRQLGINVLSCIDVLVFKKDGDDVQFLMLRREDRSISISGWEYSKGPVLFHETQREAAARELLDETGLSIDNYLYMTDLGYQAVDVHWRKKNYEIMHLLGMTYLLIGNEDSIVPYKKEGLRRSSWMSWERAREHVWMRDYGPRFFDRWKEREDRILSLASTLVKR